MWESAFQKVFRDQYTLFLKKAGKDSAVRGFAQYVNLSPSSTSELLSGRLSWRLRPSRARQILERFELPEESYNRLLCLMEESEASNKVELQSSNYDMLINWVYPAVLFAYELAPELRSLKQIAKRLGVSEDLVREVTNDLLSRGLLEKEESGSIRRTQKFWSTTDDIPNSVIEEHHRSNLELAKQALDYVQVNERDFTSLTFAGTPEELATIKKEIRKLYELALALMKKSETNTEIYRLSAQIFPIKFDTRSKE